jgi:hypothetical protein
MPLLSIWDYLRQKTRDSVLAGFQEALDVVEQNDDGEANHRAADNLQHRLATAAVLEARPRSSLSGPMEQGSSRTAVGTTAVGTTADRRSAAEPEPSSVDLTIDAALDGSSPSPNVNGQASHPSRRKRGRPRKDQTQ